MAPLLIDKHNITANTILDVYRNIERAVRDKGTRKRSKLLDLSKSYNYIPSSECHLEMIIEHLYTYRTKFTKEDINICDFGCGDGIFIQLVSSYLRCMSYSRSVNVGGIELDETLEECSYNMVIRREDFFETPIAYIKRQDIIYAYNPLLAGADNGRLAQRIQHNMKVGAHFIFATSNDTPRYLLELGFKVNMKYPLYTYIKT